MRTRISFLAHNTRLGRRAFLCTVASGGAMSKATAPVRSIPSGALANEPTLTTITPSDTDFDTFLATHFPHIISTASFETYVRPYLTILRNDTGLLAKGYALRWKVLHEDGAIGFIDNFFVQRHHMRAYESKVLGPGAVRLLSPLYNLAPKEIPIGTPITDAAKGKIVATTLDGVLFEGGIFVGNNNSLIRERYVACRHAEHDAAVSVNRMYRANLSDSEIYQRLKDKALLAISHPDLLLADSPEGASAKSFYGVARSLEASRLVAIHDRHGAGAFRAAVAARVRYPRELATLLRMA
jgi:hypothetical protein